MRAIGRRIGLVVVAAILAAASLTACRDQTVSEPDPNYYQDQLSTDGYNRSFDDPFENSYGNHEERMKQWSDPCPNGPAYC